MYPKENVVYWLEINGVLGSVQQLCDPFLAPFRPPPLPPVIQNDLLMTPPPPPQKITRFLYEFLMLIFEYTETNSTTD